MRLVAFFLVTAGTALLSVAGERAQEQNPEEQILRSAGFSTDAEALLEFFRQRMLPKADLDELLPQARRLGDANPQTRAKAAAQLIARGHWAVPALRHVVNDLDNPLAAEQARRCLDFIEGSHGSELLIAAIKLLVKREPPAATETLLAFLPFAADDSIVGAVKTALDNIAARPGKLDPALMAALRDPLPMRRAIVVEVLAGSRRQEVLPEIRKILSDANPQVRLRSALALAQRLDEQAIGTLIQLLSELPTKERHETEKVLQQLAGEWSPNLALRGDDETAASVRREAWIGWWKAVDGPSLLAAIRKRTLSGDETARVETLIVQLGDDSFARRERAVADLIAMGTKVVGLLREAVKSTDLERKRRAETCLKQIALIEEKERLPTAAPRLLAVRKPPGAAGALLGYLAYTEEHAMKEEIGKALKHLAVIDGKPDPVVIAALSDPLPVRRLAAAEALAGAGGAALPAVRKLMTDADPEVRLHVALALVHAQDREAVPVLIDLVADLPRDQAFEAEDLLRRLAGAKAPVIAWGKDDAAARKKFRDAWNAWWKANGDKVNLAELERTTGMAGLTVVAELVPKGKAAGFGAAVVPAPATDRLVALDQQGKPQWQIENLDHPIDFQVLSGDRVLVAEYKANRVTERDLKGNVLWQVNNLPGNPINVQRLPNGNTFIAVYTGTAAGNYYLMEVDRAGKTVSNITKPNKGAAPPITYMRAAYRLSDGQFICLLSNNTCARMDATGKELKSFPMTVLAGVNFFGNIDVTSKGHVIVAQNNNTVVEFDPDGKIVWQANVAGNRAVRLANGNTLVASENGGMVVELDASSKTVWMYRPPAGYQPLRARRASGAMAVSLPTSVRAPAKTEIDGIEAKIVTAWENAGGRFGWITRASGDPGVTHSKARPADANAMPGFWFPSAPAKGALAALPSPEAPFGLHFNLTNSKKGGVTDAHLKELAGQKDLRALYLRSNQITDAGLKMVGGHKQLQTLDLNFNQVTDAGMKELSVLKQLQILRLGGNKITDAGLKDLSGLKQLTILNLESTGVTDAGLKELAGLKKLEDLNLRGTNVTDAGIKDIVGMNQLLSLTLQNTQVTNAALKELAAMKELQNLDLRGTKVTSAAIADLQKARPNLTVNYATGKAAK